jgi:hypothetical protein
MRGFDRDRSSRFEGPDLLRGLISTALRNVLYARLCPAGTIAPSRLMHQCFATL